MSSLPAVCALSDDDPSPTCSPPTSQSVDGVRGRGDGQVKRRCGEKKPGEALVRQRLTRLSYSICKCARRSFDRSRSSCFLKFRSPEAMRDVSKLRREIQSLHKLDADQRDLRPNKQLHTIFSESMLYNVFATPSELTAKVYDLLQNRPAVGVCQLLGKAVCETTFCKLIGIGQNRYGKLRRAIRTGQLVSDGRFTVKARTKPAHPHREMVFEFLQEIRTTLAEPCPEVMEAGAAARMSFRKVRGRRPKLCSRQSNMSRDSKKDLKLLPPGSLTDYLQLLNARIEGPLKISLKLFSKAAYLYSEV